MRSSKSLDDISVWIKRLTINLQVYQFGKAEVVDPPHFAGGFTLQIALELKPLGLLSMNGIDSGIYLGNWSA